MTVFVLVHGAFARALLWGAARGHIFFTLA